jgi:hypothetical protein
MQGSLYCLEGPNSIRLSGRQFHLFVPALCCTREYHSASLEPIRHPVFVAAKKPSHLLHRCNLRPHRSGRPFAQEPAGSAVMLMGPRPLKVLPQEIASKCRLYLTILVRLPSAPQSDSPTAADAIERVSGLAHSHPLSAVVFPLYASRRSAYSSFA